MACQYILNLNCTDDLSPVHSISRELRSKKEEQQKSQSSHPTRRLKPTSPCHNHINPKQRDTVWPNVHQSGVSAFISIMQCWSFPIQHAHSFLLANTQNNFIHPFSHSQIPSLRQTHINKLKEEELFPHMSIFAAFLPNQPISQTVMLCVRLTGNYLSPIFLSFPLIPFFHSSCFALSWPLTPQQWEHSVCVDRYSLSLDCCLRPLAPYRPRKLLYSVIFFLFPECTVVECKLTWCLHVHFREIVLDYLPAKPHCLVFSFHNFLINFTYFKELRRKAVQATDRPTC